MDEVKPKSGRGGKRPGAGRKPMKVEDNARLAIQAAINDDPGVMTRIWKKFLEKALKGSTAHQKLLCAYYYGLPVENVNVSTKQMILKRIIVDVGGNSAT